MVNKIGKVDLVHHAHDDKETVDYGNFAIFVY